MTRSYKKRKKQKPQFYKYLVVGGIIVGIIFLILLKDQTAKSSTDFNSAVSENNVASTIVATVVETAETPEEKFDRLLLENEPIFAFFHSNSCQRCIDMINIVEEVFPEFEGKISLVDVNVYDEQSKNLLRRAEVQAIPTQIFIDNSGLTVQTVGLMTADQLRSALENISGD